MGQTCQDDTRTEPSRPGESGLTTRMVEKNIQQQQQEQANNVYTQSEKNIYTMFGHVCIRFISQSIN